MAFSSGAIEQLDASADVQLTMASSTMRSLERTRMRALGTPES